MNVFLSAGETVLSVTSEPMAAAPGEDIIFAVTIIDADSNPAGGVSVSLLNVEDNSTVGPVITDATGVAIFDAVTRATPGVVFYQVYIESTATESIGQARFYDSSIKFPTVTNAMDDHALDEYEIAAGVQMIVPVYHNVNVGDYLTYYWGSEFHASHSIEELSDLPLTLDVNNQFPPSCLVDGDYEVFYQYLDEAGNANVSKPWAVTVSGGNQPATLTPPSVPEADDGWINISDAADGTNIGISYKSMQANDAITLTWQVYDEGKVIIESVQYNYSVLASDVTNGFCTIPVLATDIPVVQRGSADVWYTMQPANGDSIQTSEVAHIGIDTVA
ncbi:UNVERIFIED_ORG: hypothetical protein J2Y78_004906 [Buttiauxella agrestis ATCC 33320]